MMTMCSLEEVHFIVAAAAKNMHGMHFCDDVLSCKDQQVHTLAACDSIINTLVTEMEKIVKGIDNVIHDPEQQDAVNELGTNLTICIDAVKSICEAKTIIQARHEALQIATQVQRIGVETV